MTALQQLNAHIQRLELRVRLFAASEGMAIVAPLALILTLLLVWISNRYQFAQQVVLPLRILLFAVLAAAVSLWLVRPLLKLNRRRVTRLAEQRIPGFEQRLLTLAERPDTANPFTELLAEDALRIARASRLDELKPARTSFALIGAGAIAAAVLLWLVISGPGYWGYGASLLWTGTANAGKRPLYDVAVQPGNKTVRRRTDQLITAETFGFSARNVNLYARHAGALKWEQAAMQPKADGNGYQFLFAGLSDAVEYYVQADAAQSKHFTLNVKDLPGVKRIRVNLHFPSGLGLQDAVYDPGGDVRAVQGTAADISVLTDRPLDHGLLVMENGTKIRLVRGEGNWLSARLKIDQDGSYHVAALDNGEAVRISEDYFIESKKDEPPSVKILRPGHDPRVSPIEEVPVTVEAADDFGVKDLQLHYSINGGPEQNIPLSGGKSVKEVEGKTTLYFENFKVMPGDVVSFYATAKDANTTAQSDIIFAQAEPFDFKFSQSQQVGAGMGSMGMGDQENISERQKQIIAATFNEIRGAGENDKQAAGEHARLLSELETKLGEQTKTLADRMANRELGAASSQFEEFSKLMTQASSQMNDAVSDLKPAKWHDALSPEQRALQSLLRAEALFRDIQVASGQQGGAGGSGAQRDLARMFDLELDTSKNQYETGQSAAADAEKDQQKALDDAFQRLQMLARRQQELADQNAQQQAFEQRWQEEQLRREAEELRQQMQQQLAQNSQGQQQQSPQRGNQQSSSSRSSSSSQAGQAAANQTRQREQQTADALRQAMKSLQMAEDQMRQAVSQRDSTAQQRAAAQLREAEESLKNMLHQQAGSSMSDLAERAQDIANTQKGLADQMKQLYGEDAANTARRGQQPFGMTSESSSGGEDTMPEMNDPDSIRYGYGFRRRNWQQELQPRHAATEQEKALANQKERLAQQLEQLQRDLQQQAQGLASTQPGASSKLRQALSEAEQKELALRMQKDAEWMREGYGDRNLGMEDGVTAGVQKLSQQLRDAQRALDAAGQPGQNGTADKTAEELSRVRGLREELERATQSGEQASGSQARDSAGPIGGDGPAHNWNNLQDGVHQLEMLRAQIDPHDRALYGYINGALGNMQHLTGAQAGLLDARLSREALVSLERLEVELNKRALEQRSTGTRTAAPEQSPEQYRDAVAEYFKKLSK